MIEFIEQVKRHAATQANALAQPRLARVTSVDAVNHAVKLMLMPGEVLTGWVPTTTLATGGLRIAAPPEVGSLVVALPQEGDAQHWIVIGCLYSTQEMPAVSPATGQPVQPGEFGAFLPSGNYLHMTGTTTYLGGDLRVAGEVYDQHGSLDRLRGHYNGHVHGGVTWAAAIPAGPTHPIPSEGGWERDLNA